LSTLRAGCLYFPLSRGEVSRLRVSVGFCPRGLRAERDGGRLRFGIPPASRSGAAKASPRLLIPPRTQ
jgi:hypothetical protein